MEQSVEKIIERNLLEVFNGRDADSRRAAIDELWKKDGVFIDPGGVHEGVEKINATAELLFAQFEGFHRGSQLFNQPGQAFLPRPVGGRDGPEALAQERDRLFGGRGQPPDGPVGLRRVGTGEVAPEHLDLGGPERDGPHPERPGDVPHLDGPVAAGRNQAAAVGTQDDAGGG